MPSPVDQPGVTAAGPTCLRLRNAGADLLERISVGVALTTGAVSRPVGQLS